MQWTLQPGRAASGSLGRLMGQGAQFARVASQVQPRWTEPPLFF